MDHLRHVPEYNKQKLVPFKQWATWPRQLLLLPFLRWWNVRWRTLLACRKRPSNRSASITTVLPMLLFLRLLLLLMLLLFLLLLMLLLFLLLRRLLLLPLRLLLLLLRLLFPLLLLPLLLLPLQLLARCPIVVVAVVLVTLRGVFSPHPLLQEQS